MTARSVSNHTNLLNAQGVDYTPSSSQNVSTVHNVHQIMLPNKSQHN